MNITQHCFEECNFIIFGITGDLSRRKIIPALYKLIEDRRLCKFSIIGVASSDTSPEEIIAKATSFISDPKEEIIAKLLSVFTYYRMDFNDNNQYAKFHTEIKSREDIHQLPGNRIFYFATMPEHFMVITKNLVDAGVLSPNSQPHHKTPWSRVVYEKPFGHNLRSSRIINRYLAQVFDESHIFRIDHYLGKELVGNIAITRFTNRVFEPLWNNKHIESVDIVIKEKIGIEDRGTYFDAHGVIKDMVQSHLLQLLALTAMEAPRKLTATELRNEKAKVLKKVGVKSVLKGQYEGYTQEKKVHPASKTETFAAVELFIDNKRWQGVPFNLVTGKCLDTKESYIKITFKQAECLLQQCSSQPNYLRINIQPNEGIYLDLNAKALGSMTDTMPITMEFCHSCQFGPNTPEAYEVLLADVIKGDHSAFIRNDEIEASWKIIEKIETFNVPIKKYAKGSRYPE